MDIHVQIIERTIKISIRVRQIHFKFSVACSSTVPQYLIKSYRSMLYAIKF
jgi:hypothetical protein